MSTFAAKFASTASTASSPLLSHTHVFPTSASANSLRSSILALASPSTQSHPGSPSAGAGPINSYFPEVITPLLNHSAGPTSSHRRRGRSVSTKVVASPSALVGGEAKAVPAARGRTATISFGSRMSQLSTMGGASSPVSFSSLSAAFSAVTPEPAAPTSADKPEHIAPTPLHTPVAGFAPVAPADLLTLDHLSLLTFPLPIPAHSSSPLRPKLVTRAERFTADMAHPSLAVVNPRPAHNISPRAAPTPLHSPSPLAPIVSATGPKAESVQLDRFRDFPSAIDPRVYEAFSSSVSFDLSSNGLAAEEGMGALEKDTRNADRDATPANRGFAMEKDGSWLGIAFDGHDVGSGESSYLVL